jgi:ADP-ribosylglycohydrolase
VGTSTLSKRVYPQVINTAERLNARLKMVLTQARVTHNKDKALEHATIILNEFADYLVRYTWQSRVKQQLKKPVDLSVKEKEEYKKQLVKEKIKEFKKILDDAF